MFFDSAKKGSKFRGSGMKPQKRSTTGPTESIGVASVSQMPGGKKPNKRQAGKLALPPAPEVPRKR